MSDTDIPIGLGLFALFVFLHTLFTAMRVANFRIRMLDFVFDYADGSERYQLWLFHVNSDRRLMFRAWLHPFDKKKWATGDCAPQFYRWLNGKQYETS